MKVENSEDDNKVTKAKNGDENKEGVRERTCKVNA